MAFDFSNITDEELEAMAAQSAPASEPMPQKPLSEWTDEELEAYAAEPTPAPAQSAVNPSRMTSEERIAANNRAIERAQQPGAGEDGFDLAVLEGVKGAARAVKSIGGGIVGMVSGAARLAGTPVRLATGWEGLHRLADTIDSSYENFGRDALMSEYGENPDGWGYALGRAGEKVAGVAGSLAALGGVGKAVGAAGTALKAAGHAKTAAAVANTLPLMFGNDAAVRAYDTARANGKSKGESAALAGLNGAIHFLGFKAFENKALNKMLGMPAEMEGLMPKWAGEAAEAGGQSFSSLARGVRNGMIKYTLAERGKGALRAGGIMGLQNFLSDPVMQVAEGASIDDIDFSRALKAGAHGVGEGVLMEGLMGGAAIYKSQKAAEKFIADKIFRGKDYKVVGPDGKPHDEPGLLNSSEGRMMLMKQNPDATERVLDIVEHGGTPRPTELDAAFLPPDMTAEELKKFASDWRKDLQPYVDEAWAADAPRQTAAPDAAAAEPGRDMLSLEEAQSQQKAANDAAERQKLADRRAAADSMMLDFESWNRLYTDGKTDLNFDEWRAAGKPGVIEANLTPKTEEAPTSETRANEEPAQPKQAEVVVTATGEAARPVEGAEARPEAADARVVAQPAVWPNGWDNAGEEIKGYVVPNDGDVAPGREVAIAHRSGGSINAPQKIKGVVESIDGDKVKVYYRDGMGYDQHDTFKKSELVGVMPLTAVPTEGATSQTAENRAEATQEGAGARSASETATATPAPASPAEAASRVSDAAAAGAPPAESVPDGKGKMVKPKAAESDYGVTMFEEPAVDGEGVSYVVKDGPSDAHRMMFKSKAEAEARLAELRAERKAIMESPSATLADGKKVRLLKTDEGWIPYDENYNDLRHGMFNAAKTKAEAIKVAEKGVKWARDLTEENARFKAESASRASDAENIPPNLTEKPAETAKPVAEAPKTDVSATAPAESGNAAPVVENRGDAATVAAPESVEAKIAAMKRGSPEQLKAQREYVEREVAKAKDAIKGKFRPKTGRLSPREKAADAYERVKNTGDIPETVNIKVPGDGEITVKNNPNGMAFLDRFAAKFRPHPTSGESAMALPRSPSIKVADKPKAESAEKEFAPFVSKDKTRERMMKPYTEGKMVVATDGRVAIRRPLRKGESVKGADDAPRTAQIFGRAEDAATENAAIDVQAIFPKLQQALALEGSVFVESYEPETGKVIGLRPLTKSHAVELWRDAGGALQVRSRDTDGNSYASDAWSGDSAPVAAFDGKALVEIMRLAAKNGEGKIEVRFAKDAQNNPVLFKFGGYEAALMPLRAKGHFDEARRVDGENARANPAVSAEGAKSASRASGAKSNRLRRADGTDPLAEKNPAPKTVRKAVDKISSAIANRTGTGVITPEEADGIVRGIVESPETKHNRYRDFFDPLEKDAAWHESMGLDAESAKNIRDAFDRVKADADLKKWFPQVDSAVKKAKDGNLSKKDAAPLFGKISEGLEKAERMGLSETANRLREAAEVIRPVAETVEQGDVSKFNYSTKGKKLNNRLGGTDKRGGKTVSLDTKDGTIDVAADGKRGLLDGNRHLIIDGVNGDELTVTMKDAAGKTLATRKMNRAQWSALAKGAVATDGDPAAPQKGDLIRMSRSDATDAPQSWTSETQKPLERVAHALRNVVTVGGKRIKVEFLNERPESDGPGAFKNSDGVTVGDYVNGEIRLYPGATVADVVHEFTHPLVDFARAEAKAGRGELLGKINQIIDAERATWEQPVRDAYKGESNETILEEIFTHAMGEKGADLFGKSTKTLQGRRWYNRLWDAIKGVWQDFATKMGWNKADLRGLERMSPEDAAQKILSEMAKGRNFGDAVRPASSRIMDYEQTKREKFTEKFIDSFAPVKSVQDEIGGVKEVTRADGYTDHTKSTDLVAAKDRANGRIEYELRQHQFRVDDINRDLARAALPKQSTEDLVDDFNLYLQCKHAPERNRSIAQDRGDAYTPDYSEGMGQITLPGGNRIGLSENVADRLLKGMRGKYGLKFKMFENAADKIYNMLEADLDRRFDAGRLSAEDYAFYKTRWHGPGGADGKWAHYVPLKTDMERLEPEALNSSTAGMKRNEFMKAQGRGSGDIADSPLAAAVLQTEQGIRGSIKNEVANVEANLVEHAQKRGIPIAEIVPGDEIRRGRTYSFTFADGETVDASGSMRLVENHPEIHLFKRDGKLYAIRYKKGKNGRGLAFARAASGENMGRWGQGTEWIPRMTHWMSAMRTQYSPEFTVSNWLADHLEAAQALVGRYGLKEGGKAFAKTVASEIQNWKDLRAYLKDGTANGYIKEFVEGGGLTKGGVASEGFDAETQKIRSKIEQFRREQKQWREMSPADLAKSAGRYVTDLLSFANELAEYSTRTGLYTALRKQNVPQADAIKFARDATVNFNRKGTAMPYINGLYMFANASVQGAVRSVQAMRDTHGKELIAALTAIGVAKAVIDNYLGNDDEREAAGGRNARNQSEYDKKHNVGVPIGGGRQIVPLRFRGPYAAVPYLAQTAANVAMGATSPEDGAKTLVRELGDQVTDIVGGNGIMNDRGEFDGSLIGQSIAPSVADPIVQLATGKDYKGDERRRKSFDKTMPASSNGKRNTGDWYKVAAQTLNRMSGGNEHRKGLVDVAPEDLQLVLEFLGGAPMRDLNNVVSSVNNAVQLAAGGTPERTLSQIPFVRRVVREYPESTSRYYNALEEYERDKAEFKKTTPERRREMKSEKPYLFVGKSLLDGQIERVKEYMHLERGEVKVGQKWVEPKAPRTEKQKEEWRKKRLALQAQILERLGK